MARFLIVQEGLLQGTVLTLDDTSSEWVVGRDADVASLVIEDPTVSRKHLFIRKEGDLFIVENLSLVSPTRQNGRIIEEPTPLKEGDILQLGHLVLLFSDTHLLEEPTAAPENSAQEESLLSFFHPVTTRWMLKVISGTQVGAEFPLEENREYTLGKDARHVDICFYDVSISKQHAKLIFSPPDIFIEDLGSRNGTLINGAPIDQKTSLESGDLITLGTTSMLLVDREAIEKTIYAPTPASAAAPFSAAGTAAALSTLETLEESSEKKSWRDLFIPTRHLIAAFSLGALLLTGIVALISLFHSEPIIHNAKADTEIVEQTLRSYPYITFSYNPAAGQLFIAGHLLTRLSLDELSYKLKTLSFVQSIDNNIIVDEQVWDNMNALLATNSSWRSVFIQSARPGLFVAKGYVASQEDLSALTDYLSLNFPYQDKLQIEVFVASAIEMEVGNLLITQGFSALSFQFSNGDLTFNGRLGLRQKEDFERFMQKAQKIEGVKLVKNLVAFAGDKTSRTDLSSKYTINGYSEMGSKVDSVLIQGKIYRIGDLLDGMTITALSQGQIDLEKENIEYRIQYS